MTPAERKAASRANQRAKQEDVERRNLVTELMRVYRRQQASIVDDGKTPEATAERHRAAREQRRTYHNGLMQLPVAGLRSALEVQQETVDSHGRLHNERSGARSYHEIEQLADIANAGDDDELSPPDSRRVRPEGTGSDDTDSDNDDDARPNLGKPQYTPTTEEKRLKKVIDRIIGEMVVEDAPVGEAVGAKCPFCERFFLSELGAANHLREQYEAGLREHERFLKHLRTTSELMNELLPAGFAQIGTTEPNSAAYHHFLAIEREMSKK